MDHPKPSGFSGLPPRTVERNQVSAAAHPQVGCSPPPQPATSPAQAAWRQLKLAILPRLFRLDGLLCRLVAHHVMPQTLPAHGAVPQEPPGVSDPAATRPAPVAGSPGTSASTLRTHYLVHEFRSQLGVVIGVARLLAQATQRDADVNRRLLSALLLSANLLARLVADWDQPGRWGDGRFALEPRELQPGRWLSEWCVLLEAPGVIPPGAAAPQLVLDAGLPAMVADPDRLSQCLMNLVSNAYKHGNGVAGVTLRCRRRGDEIEIAVLDRGPGLTPQQIERLFQPFERLGRNDAVPGMGLGLALTQLLVTAMGGRVQVTSQEGAGACFAILLPVAGQAVAARPVDGSLPG